ncbi:hypothetical protein ACFWPK_22545 [Nocardia sp. NPDC058519]|uniref:hypothetical protein n=1 Tax=Nocardia sp. NPDC058519 TaxID=3346535 RepID=UPI0036567ECF
MRSIVWRLRDGTEVQPGRLYQVRHGYWVEPEPVACPNGHRLGPGRVLVGSLACPAAGGHHRTHCCRTCGAVIMWPPPTERCAHTVFDERRAR